jgi:hypothetical protein
VSAHLEPLTEALGDLLADSARPPKA